jgi:thiol-disulfide isomerase/thioredoxin
MFPELMRRVLLLLFVIAGLGLVFWSGYHNLRARRTESQTASTAAALVADQGTPSADSPAITSTLKGKPAPAFTLTDLDGKKVSLSDFKGHPMVVNFWATYCGPCKYEMPWLEEFSHKYADTGFKVIGVDYDSEVGAATIAKNVHQLGATYPILLSDPKIEKDYLSDSDAGVLPMSFYIDKAGKVIEVTAGVGTKDQLETMVKETVGAGAS